MEPETHTTSARESDQLQRHLDAHPDSPLFSILADAYLQDGMQATALKTAEAGLAFHPDHPGAHLVAAKASILLRRYNDARRYIDRLLELAPGSLAAQALSAELKTLELRFPPSTSVAQHESGRATSSENTRSGKHRKRWSWEDHVIGGAMVFTGDTAATHAEETQTPETAPAPFHDTGTDLELLAQRLETARIPPVREGSAVDDIPPTPDVAQEEEVLARPVTETLARIYAKQGRYPEAIAAYRELRERQPDRTYEYTLRIIELERLASTPTDPPTS
jgi:tetratricopeptide (TPR) repeat protein